jgi:hypothetical protein
MVAGLLIVVTAVLGFLYFVRWRGISTPGAMMACLPRSGAVSVYIDMNQLREARILDLLAGTRATEELEYRQFVDDTGFDYQRDLSAVAGAFAGKTTYLLLRGQFQWKRLMAYATAKGGTCRNSVCRVPSEPGRFVSFYPVRSDTMAIAFSPDEWAVLDITPRAARANVPDPDQPIWVSVTGPALRDVQTLPSGTRSFVSPLETAQNIVLSVGAGDSSQNQLKVNLNVLCDSESAASDLVVKLEGATSMLRKMLEREKMQANPRDLSGLLVAGSFRREDRRVIGNWPMHRELIEAIASGSVD